MPKLGHSNIKVAFFRVIRTILKVFKVTPSPACTKHKTTVSLLCATQNTRDTHQDQETPLLIVLPRFLFALSFSVCTNGQHGGRGKQTVWYFQGERANALRRAEAPTDQLLCKSTGGLTSDTMLSATPMDCMRLCYTRAVASS